MLTVMCPNCRHRFPAPGCCNPGPQSSSSSGAVMQQTTDCVSNGAFYGGGYLLVPREYNSNVGGCFINAPTIIHGPTIIQQPANQQLAAPVHKSPDAQTLFTDNASWKNLNGGLHRDPSNSSETLLNNSSVVNGETFKSSLINDVNYRTNMNCHINTTCDLTGGTVTITTPGIQSGGCLIQSTDTAIIVQAPRIEIRPKLSGGGCFVQKQLSMDDDDDESFDVIYRHVERGENSQPPRVHQGNSNTENMCLLPPSGCQELPGIRRCNSLNKTSPENASISHHQENPNVQSINVGTLGNEREECCQHPVNPNSYLQQQRSFCNSVTGSEIKKRHSTCCCGSTTREEDQWRANINTNRPLSSATPITDNITKNIEKSPVNADSNGGMEIRVNATVQLPANVEHCTVNITATTGKNSERISGGSNGRTRNNFNGGGLVQVDANLGVLGNDNAVERREDAPTTPVSWLIPCPWQFDNYSQDKEVTRLADIKRLLHTSGWYHEGLSWQQSETLLKNAPVGSWLMRDSSDSRFIFAVSVQTARGPTSVRVHYFLGRFRLDAEPRLSHNMPSFECPIKMLEHYVDYSNRIDEQRKEVWVDYSGQLYSQIYLTKPLVKEVRTLSHLARLVVNKNQISTEHLPPLMKNYLAEYPYSL